MKSLKDTKSCFLYGDYRGGKSLIVLPLVERIGPFDEEVGLCPVWFIGGDGVYVNEDEAKDLQKRLDQYYE